MATYFLSERCFITDLDGAIIIPKAHAAAIETARWHDRVAKRACDEGLPLNEEGDARGWSSAVLERDLALRLRGGHASSSRGGCGLIVGAVTADEHRSCAKEPTPADSLAAKAAFKTEIDDSFLTHFYLNVL